MSLIIIIIIAIYFILIAWTWQILGNVEKTKKVAVIIIGILIMSIVTLIVFNISKVGLNYENTNAQADVRNVLVTVFTGINGIIVIPQLAKVIEKISEDEIDKKTASRKFLIIAIIFIVCVIIECGYMKDIQKGIINIYNIEKNG